MIPSTKKFNPSRVASLFFLLFLITLFFPIRYVFPTPSSFATGLYSDFTSISLYLSDILLFIAFIFTLWSNKSTFFKPFFAFRFSLFAFLIWLILSLFWHFESFSGLNIWYFAKFIGLVIVSYGTVTVIFSSLFMGEVRRGLFLLIFVCLGTLQSIIGLTQFINQSPIGLNSVGEQVIGSGIWGVAKIVSGGTVYIRAYGTFPHPNLLSAFLVASILINIYLMTSTTWKKSTAIWLNLALFINILGLTVTFSRGAFLALGVGLVVYFGMQYFDPRAKSRGQNIIAFDKLRQQTNINFLKVFLALILAFLIFKPFLLTRATVSDQATIERGIYNRTAINMIKDKPIFGLGIGESMLHMKQYSPVKLNPWQIQPIHNYFLLAASELGIIGALVLIWIFLSHLKAIIYKLKTGFDSYYLLLTTLLLTFLVLMLFDHYFYTLQQTQMLLWMVLGLIAAETSSPVIAIRQVTEKQTKDPHPPAGGRGSF